MNVYQYHLCFRHQCLSDIFLIGISSATILALVFNWKKCNNSEGKKSIFFFLDQDKLSPFSSHFQTWKRPFKMPILFHSFQTLYKTPTQKEMKQPPLISLSLRVVMTKKVLMRNSPQDFPDQLVLGDDLLPHRGIQLTTTNLKAGPVWQKQTDERTLMTEERTLTVTDTWLLFAPSTLRHAV